MTISGFIAYVKQAWKNKPDTSTPLSADRLLHIEDGIKGNSDAIEKIATAVVDQIVNDPNKIASMAALYSVNQAVNSLNSDFGDLDVSRYFSVVGNNGTLGNLIAYKHAKAVWIYGRVDNLLNTEQAIIQCSNPDLRPIVNMLGYGMSYTGSSIATDTIPVLVNVNATGDIRFSSWQAFKLYTQFFIIYPVK